MSFASRSVSSTTGVARDPLPDGKARMDRDPLSDIRQLGRPIIVINDGHIAIDRLERGSPRGSAP